jgi:hypothetical protein
MSQVNCIYMRVILSMYVVSQIVATISLVGLVFVVPFIFVDQVGAQSQNVTPSMVINMSDLTIKVGNTTSNETITFSNNTRNTLGEIGNTTR